MYHYHLTAPMSLLTTLTDALLHFCYPHICNGCGTDVLSKDSTLCLRCINNLPETGFEIQPDNPIEKKFWGRLPVQYGMAQYYFTPQSLLQQLMHQLKYSGEQQLGRQLGRLMGESLINANWSFIDALVPLPLFPEKEKLRGYNQATVLCEGIAEKMHIPILHNAIIRPAATETQTRKNRVERWQNMEGRFRLRQPELIEHKHILLIDDVITTGATLEACGAELLKANDVQLSIASLAYAARS